MTKCQVLPTDIAFQWSCISTYIIILVDMLCRGRWLLQPGIAGGYLILIFVHKIVWHTHLHMRTGCHRKGRISIVEILLPDYLIEEVIKHFPIYRIRSGAGASAAISNGAGSSPITIVSK